MGSQKINIVENKVKEGQKDGIVRHRSDFGSKYDDSVYYWGEGAGGGEGRRGEGGGRGRLGGRGRGAGEGRGGGGRFDWFHIFFVDLPVAKPVNNTKKYQKKVTRALQKGQT